MLVKPASGLKLRDPATKLFLGPEGLEVPDDDPLWNRMLADKDVVKVKAPAAKEDAK